jgi:hypothetical protein
VALAGPDLVNLVLFLICKASSLFPQGVADGGREGEMGYVKVGEMVENSVGGKAQLTTPKPMFPARRTLAHRGRRLRDERRDG